MTNPPVLRRLTVALFLVVMVLASCTSGAEDVIGPEVEPAQAAAESLDTPTTVQLATSMTSVSANDATRRQMATGDVEIDGPVEQERESYSATDSSQASPTAKQVWALVLAGASDPNDPLLTDIAADVADLGFDSSPTNCDRGAAEALGMSPDTTYTVSVHFDSESEARGAVGDLESIGLVPELANIEAACPE